MLNVPPFSLHFMLNLKMQNIKKNNHTNVRIF